MKRVLKWTIGAGALGFVPGFFGPMLLPPGANQGPLLGILITGPTGLALGLCIGLWREWRRPPGDSAERRRADRASPPSWESLLAHPLTRVIAALLALLFLAKGMEGLKEGAGRGAGAAVVIAIVAAWFAATGRIPSRARR